MLDGAAYIRFSVPPAVDWTYDCCLYTIRVVREDNRQRVIPGADRIIDAVDTYLETGELPDMTPGLTRIGKYHGIDRMSRRGSLCMFVRSTNTYPSNHETRLARAARRLVTIWPQETDPGAEGQEHANSTTATNTS